MNPIIEELRREARFTLAPQHVVQLLLRAAEAIDAAEARAAQAENALSASLNRAVRLQRENDELTTLAAIGTWHDECRPNREMAARELLKSQAIIDKVADRISELEARAEQLRRLAKEATNGWACYAKRKIEHDDITRLHREIDTVSETPTPQSPS